MKIFKIAVDAGHGNNTPGKRTPDGYREHWINVKCANYCNEALKRCGFKTLKVAWNDLNSKDDADIGLTKRQNMIKAAGCDISVSFHANASGTGWNDANGAETLISDKDSAVGDSKKLAEAVQRRICEGTKQKNRGVKRQALSMCNCTKMGVKAAILIEIGFMTNRDEAELMKGEAFCKEQAEDVVKGICDYLNIKYIEEKSVKYPQVALPVLKKGEKGSEVKLLQQDLNFLKFKGKDGKALDVDGSFGDNTEYALKAWQKKHKLQVDGSYGKASYKKMQELLNLF